ncbi:MAG: flagellar biosynthetic protein FliO [Acidobacteriaceae bacterium]
MKRVERVMLRVTEEGARRGAVDGSEKTMSLVLSPVFDGSAPMPRPSWTMRLGLWLRRLMSLPTAGEIPIRVEGRLSLGPKKSLVLVNCRGKSVLLALGGEAITPVMEVPVPRRRRKEPAS